MEKPDSPEKVPVPVAFFKKRSAKSKANLRKRPATPPPADSDSDSDLSSSENEVGQRVKRRKRTALITAASGNPASGKGDVAATVFTADRSAPITSTNDATKQSNWYDDDDALPAKKLLGSTRQLPSKRDRAQPDGTYKGLANQTSFIQKNPDAPTRTVGPIKAPTNIRTITVTDFAPDVCKDYKLTGFCGFGDNCKFLHSREDYKQGWQLDKEWETVTKGKKNLGGTVVASTRRDKLAHDDEDEDDEALLKGIPFKCHICKGPYREPIVTRCGHYFCESCALKRSGTTCAACGVGTSGLFKTATGLQKLLARKRERAARRRQEALEAGEEVSEEDEEDEEE
ncbi:pre-mRNA splicing factor cwc24 [Ophiocordyceps camponoti-floridani]|uniref:Pre-mRNA-splicing factor CWC24 n=1 Tax=Ophiocordyceps camponoti-floridani TaxID=2030778 RepID=A0A8H4Q2N7_9HYPO|nr:pre-mRNA splicing factor cwc24 [Ophiocordyceps camponoti-floridani]